MRPGHSVRAITKQSLIDQLYFTKIDERLTNLTAAQGQTCRWFLTKPEYASWHDPVKQLDHGGFLWIKGNPGTGKSTLMKLLFEEAKLNAKDDPSQITLSFFFLARGTVEEKSTIGLYRSLLHQLFERAAELVDSLEWLTIDGARAIQRNGWGEEALKQTLVRAVQKLGSRSLTIFIDALDECDTNQAASMICFLEELCDYAIEAQVKLNICLSSRHYPTIVIQKGIEVTLEDEIGHTEDIKLYIKSKFRLGKSEQAESLRSEILEKSSNIFLWVVLVLDILNSEYPNRAISVKKIRERLKEIPPRLNNLFEMILMRDGEDIGQLQLCLKWILFATHPLKPQELYFAIQLGVDKNCSGYWDQEDVELDQIKTFVRSSSKGLAEVTRNKASEVQFIHESVRDFLLGKYEAQWSGLSGNFVGHSHEVLRNCCMAQLSASIIQDVDLPDPLPQASKAPQLRENINLKFPFLKYSVLNVLRHANSAQGNGMEQGDFLNDFPLQPWMLYNNALERFDVRRYAESVSLLYILAEKNLANLIRIHPHRILCFSVESGRYGLPFLAALATGSWEAVQVFLDVWAESYQQVPLFRYLSKLYYENGNKPTRVSRDFTFLRKESVFANITELCDPVVFAFLCVLGELYLEPKEGRSQAPLSEAIGIGHRAVVQLLLEKGANLEFKDRDGRTPLSWAAQNGHEAVVQLLLENGADLDSKDCRGRMPLSLAAEKGHEVVVKMLLDTGKVHVDSKDEGGRTPLSWAAEKGHWAVVKMLLDTGKVEVDSKDKEGWTPILRAAAWKLPSSAAGDHEAVVKMLLDTGKVDVHCKDMDGRTPLSRAKEMLLSYKNTYGDHALQDYQIQLMLLDQQNKKRLLMAKDSIHDREVVVEQLLASGGVHPNSKDPNGRTPLSWAAEGGLKTVVKMLLDTGKVDVDSKDEGGRTPLSWAAERAAEKDREAVVKMLLDTDKVDVE